LKAEFSPVGYTSGSLFVQLLGGFAVTLNGRAIPDDAWKLRKVRGLVKLIALAPGHRLARDQVIETLWPEAGLDSGINRFHQALYNARRVFDHAYQHASGGQGQTSPILDLKEGFLVLAPGWNVQIDVEQFQQAAGRAEAARANHAAQDPEAYQTALAWYRGDLLPDDLYEDWAAGPREVLRQECLQLLRELAHLYETGGETRRAIDVFQRQLTIEPADEEAHTGLMRLYARSGQRGLALRQYQSLSEALSELNSVPDQRARRLVEDIQSGLLLEEPVSPDWATPLPAPPRKLHNLPRRLSTFIGREKEIDIVLEMLRQSRLMTITGTGGVGKTSLAVQAAVYLSADTREDAPFPDGIWLVELAALDDPLLVPQICAQTLEVFARTGQSVLETLAQNLEHKHLLLILDNCEHLVDACARLASDLLKRCPALTVMATSREPLRLPGEKIYSLPPLPIPTIRPAPSLENLSQVDSLRLFIERAGLVSPGFTLTEENATALVLICRRVDGIPLALELAAARTRLLDVEQITARLDDAFQLLAGGSRTALPRHQTLRISMEWSCQLLSSHEKAFFANLAVFAGSWTLEAAEEVCAVQGSASVLDLLAQLVDKSLVSIVEGSAVDGGPFERRYTLLETIRQYARELLVMEKPAETGINPIRDRHLAYYARLTGKAAVHWRGPEAVKWMDILEKDLPNLYAALEWSLESMDGQSIELGLQMVADLLELWSLRSNHHDSLLWSERLLAAEEGRREGIPLQGGGFSPNRLLQRARALRFLFHGSWVEFYQHADRLNNLAESESLLRALGCDARLELGITLRMRWQVQGSKEGELKQEFLEIFREENAQIQLADTSYKMGSIYQDQGDYDRGIEYLDQSLTVYRQLGDWARISEVSVGLARAYLYQGRYQHARLLVLEAIEIARRLRSRSPEAFYWLILLEIARAEGSYREGNSYAEMALAIAREDNEINNILSGLWMLAENAWSMGDLHLAKRCADEILGLCQESNFYREIGHYLYGRIALTEDRLEEAEAQLFEALELMDAQFWPGQMANHFMGWVILFCKQGRYPTAVRIAGAIDTMVLTWYKELSPFERFEYESTVAAMRSSYPESEFTDAWAEGKKMTLDQTQALLVELKPLSEGQKAFVYKNNLHIRKK
jgi:predicted ATPase/DNA-binding SARP family transcriptional activator